MDFSSKKRPEGPRPSSERRRIAMIVHDERGNASVDWRDAPVDDSERPVLEILGEPALAVKQEPLSYDPYARARMPRDSGPRASGSTQRTDLRRLSEHIKLMRALEERKRRGEDEDD